MNQAILKTTENRAKGSRPRGRLRAKKILETAQVILSNEGYHCMTLRKIAGEMGISNGNVTYYFANKEQLLQAMISDNLTRYDEEFEREARSFPDDPRSRIRAYFQFLIDDAQNPKSQRFFYHLWALSTHNTAVASQRDRVYRHFLNQVSAHLSAVHPRMEAKKKLNQSFMLMSLIEGMNVICGSGREVVEGFDNPMPWVLEQILNIVDA